MTISLYIQPISPIAFDDWLEAVDRVDGIRQATEPKVLVDHSTGEKMSYPCAPGDIAILDGEVWVNAVEWDGKQGYIMEVEDFDQLSEALRSGIGRLCEEISAVIVDAGGEQYDWTS